MNPKILSNLTMTISTTKMVRIPRTTHEGLASHTHPRTGACIRFRANCRAPERWALPLRPCRVEPESRAHGCGGYRYRARDRTVRAMGAIDRSHDRRSGEGQAREQDDVAGLGGCLRHTVAREAIYELQDRWRRIEPSHSDREPL